MTLRSDARVAGVVAVPLAVFAAVAFLAGDDDTGLAFSAGIGGLLLRLGVAAVIQRRVRNRAIRQHQQSLRSRQVS